MKRETLKAEQLFHAWSKCDSKVILFFICSACNLFKKFLMNLWVAYGTKIVQIYLAKHYDNLPVIYFPTAANEWEHKFYLELQNNHCWIEKYPWQCQWFWLCCFLSEGSFWKKIEDVNYFYEKYKSLIIKKLHQLKRISNRYQNGIPCCQVLMNNVSTL